jgi:DNA-nicking Smr family endonuclease
VSRRSQNQPDDSALFRQEMGDVKPLQGEARSRSRPPQPEPHPRQREKDERAVLGELLSSPEDPAEMETGEELMFLRPGVQKRYLTRLRRGHYSIGDSLDLHRMNKDAARKALLGFIESACARNLGCVRVVHGKGLRSRNGPKLKVLTNRLLSRHPAVLAFASCRPVDGGTGAIAVLLKHRKK